MTEPRDSGNLIPLERIDEAIVEIRGLKVMIDSDLAAVYGVETKILVRAVKRNRERFPAGFMFQLSRDEFDLLRCQIGTSKGRGGRRHLPYAFTEHGAVMLGAVLKSQRAVEVSVFVVQAFVRMRKMLADQRQLAQRLAEFETKLASHDEDLHVVFDTLRRLMQPTEPEKGKRRIGLSHPMAPAPSSQSGPDDNRTGSKSDFITRDRSKKRRSR